nr:fatty acid hydroxylase [Burkholderiaceae bacterium]
MFDLLQNGFDAVHTALFESLVQPLVYEAGLMAHLEDAYTGTEWFLLGIVQVVALYAVLRPLE